MSITSFLRANQSNKADPASAESAALSDQQRRDYKHIDNSGWFDADFYRYNYPDLTFLPDEYDLIRHYVCYGHAEKRDPNRWFSTGFYLSRYQDVSASGMNAFRHYIQHGCAEGRITNSDGTTRLSFAMQSDKVIAEDVVEQAVQFDGVYYQANNPDVKGSSSIAYKHYQKYGEKEGRRPNEYFCPTFYKRINADVRVSGGSPFEHFIECGFKEGRLGKKKNQLTQGAAKKPLLFVGHEGMRSGAEVALLEVVKWFANHTDREINVLLLNYGPLADRYTEYADVYVLNEYTVDCEKTFTAFLRKDFEFC